MTKIELRRLSTDDGKAIGFAGMREEEEGYYGETGVALGPDYVGKGYGKQILNALVDEARNCGAKYFSAGTRTANIASHNLQKSCGFIFEKYSEEKTDPRTGEKYIVEFNVKEL